MQSNSVTLYSSHKGKFHKKNQEIVSFMIIASHQPHSHLRTKKKWKKKADKEITGFLRPVSHGWERRRMPNRRRRSPATTRGRRRKEVYTHNVTIRTGGTWVTGITLSKKHQFYSHGNQFNVKTSHKATTTTPKQHHHSTHYRCQYYDHHWTQMNTDKDTDRHRNTHTRTHARTHTHTHSRAHTCIHALAHICTQT